MQDVDTDDNIGAYDHIDNILPSDVELEDKLVARIGEKLPCRVCGEVLLGLPALQRHSKVSVLWRLLCATWAFACSSILLDPLVLSVFFIFSPQATYKTRVSENQKHALNLTENSARALLTQLVQK